MAPSDRQSRLLLPKAQVSGTPKPTTETLTISGLR
jgi:hypothetical protein